MHPNEDSADLTYRTFLVRWWHEGGAPASERSSWRFTLEEVGQPRRHGFNSLQALADFLDAELHGDDLETTDADPVNE
jgi:hypothetical protein